MRGVFYVLGITLMDVWQIYTLSNDEVKPNLALSPEAT